jgi:hypothetical protein
MRLCNLRRVALNLPLHGLIPAITLRLLPKPQVFLREQLSPWLFLLRPFFWLTSSAAIELCDHQGFAVADLFEHRCELQALRCRDVLPLGGLFHVTLIRLSDYASLSTVEGAGCFRYGFGAAAEGNAGSSAVPGSHFQEGSLLFAMS